jgi:SagB-type dehydrogenase family enzyme
MPVRLDWVQSFVSERGMFSTAELYHENSKVKPYEAEWGGEFSSPAMTNVYRMVRNPYKTYARCDRLQLPRTHRRGELARVLRRRRSVREFSTEPVSLQELGELLGLSCGVTGAQHLGGSDYLLLRSNPSGGALYPIEVYPIVFRGRDVAPGLYHYAPREHALELITAGEFQETVFQITMKQQVVREASFVIALTALTARNMFKYGERGYRYMLLDAGHLAENLYLTANVLDLGCVTIAGFIDDRLNELLDIDGVNEFAVYLFVSGHMPRQPWRVRAKAWFFPLMLRLKRKQRQWWGRR